RRLRDRRRLRGAPPTALAASARLSARGAGTRQSRRSERSLASRRGAAPRGAEDGQAGAGHASRALRDGLRGVRRASVAMRVAAWMRRRWSTPGDDIPIEALLDPGFVAIDLETTGLDPRRDAVVSVAAIPFVAGRPGEGYVTLVDPGRPIPASSTRIHGIDDARVAGAPSLDEALPGFDATCAGRVLVGHDIGFDVAVLARARRLRGLPQPALVTLDTRRLAVALHP